MQIFIYCKVTVHVSGVTAPIIRSTKNCNRSLWYSYFPPAWPDRIQFSLLLMMEERLKMDINLTQNLTAIVTGHGKTRAYLHRFKIIENQHAPAEQQHRQRIT